MATLPSSRAAKNKGQKTAVRQKDMSSESSNCVICDKVIKDQDSSNKGQESHSTQATYASITDPTSSSST